MLRVPRFHGVATAYQIQLLLTKPDTIPAVPGWIFGVVDENRPDDYRRVGKLVIYVKNARFARFCCWVVRFIYSYLFVINLVMAERVGFGLTPAIHVALIS
jgi:hypothetical protein